MRSYEQFCPVAQACEVVTERWSPLVLRELMTGSHRFNELRRGLPKISPSLLSRRLEELERAGVVERRGRPGRWAYHLTPAGEELRPVIEQLGVWGERWIRTLEPHELDASLLMWDIRRRIDAAQVPADPAVMTFELRGAAQGRRDWWLVVEQGAVDLCLVDPGRPVDLCIVTDLLTMTQIWMGDRALEAALQAGALTVEGSPLLRRELERWLLLNRFAGVGSARDSPKSWPIGQ